MNIATFKQLFYEFIENHENGSVYEHACTDKEVVLSVSVGGSCFLVRCIETNAEKNQTLR